MKMLRRLGRSAVLAMTLASALALSGVASMKMTARHSVEANAAPAFKLKLAELIEREFGGFMPPKGFDA